MTILAKPLNKATSRIGARLSPRRKFYAQYFLNWLNSNGRRAFLDDDHLVSACDECELDKFSINQAIDDLFALGLADVKLNGKMQIVTALATDIQEAA